MSNNNYKYNLVNPTREDLKRAYGILNQLKSPVKNNYSSCFYGNCGSSNNNNTGYQGPSIQYGSAMRSNQCINGSCGLNSTEITSRGSTTPW